MIKFSDLALDPRVLTAIAEAGYETPTPIQAQAIPFALEGRDVLGTNWHRENGKFYPAFNYDVR
jgi:superfamily II DNA/RNA helicase